MSERCTDPFGDRDSADTMAILVPVAEAGLRVFETMGTLSCLFGPLADRGRRRDHGQSPLGTERFKPGFGIGQAFIAGFPPRGQGALDRLD